LSAQSKDRLRYFVAALNEGSAWSSLDAFDPRPDRIVGIYLFTPDANTYLCEGTPSTALIHVETRGEWDADTDDDSVLSARENVNVDVQYEDAKGRTSDVDYMHLRDVLDHCHGLPRYLVATERHTCRQGDRDKNWVFVAYGDGTDTDEAEILEYVRTNGVI
jgi:hypothetical protein